MRMMTVRCYLAPSTIEGLGVFCHDDIRAGDVVWIHDPRLDIAIPVAEIAGMPAHVREFLDRYTYDHPDRPGYVVLDGDEGRFMNHAEAPNLDFAFGDRGLALVDIPAGTELTCNYGDFMKEVFTMQPPRHRVTGTGVAIPG
jgi:hypothetical protein